MHGHPYPAVLSFNAISGDPAALKEKFLYFCDKFMDRSGYGDAPERLNLTTPTCSTMNMQAPHALTNTLKVPVHYYRLDYKRIDGDGMTANWRKWYPFTQYPKVHAVTLGNPAVSRRTPTCHGEHARRRRRVAARSFKAHSFA